MRMDRADGTIIVMLWVGRCDGPLSRFEIAHLLSKCLKSLPAANGAARLEACLRRMSTLQGEELIQALHAMSVGRSIAERKSQLANAVEMAMVDVRAGVRGGAPTTMPTAAVHVLRMLADALSGGSDGMKWFAEACKKIRIRVPLAGDLSSPAWWMSGGATIDADSDRMRAYTSDEMQRMRDLAVLGLEINSTSQQVESAFRFWVRLLHPDTVKQLPPEIQTIAERTYHRIQDARRRLKTS
jgi:hypothetical protein